jgi:quinoprotein glucose dehydrogenase
LDAMDRCCVDVSPEVRAQAARTLERAANSDSERRARYGSTLMKLLNDSSARVRCFSAISIGRLKYENAFPALLQLASQDGEDPTLRHAATMGLALSQSPETLAATRNKSNDLQRLTAVVALGMQKSPLVATFLNDPNERISLEAARAIWDRPIPAAMSQLAAIVESKTSLADPLLRRVLAANVAARENENLQSLIQFACRTDISDSARELAWEHVRSWATPSSRDPVNGDWRPLEKRPSTDLTAALTDSIPILLASSRSNPRGLIIAAECGVSEAYGPLLDVVADGNQ